MNIEKLSTIVGEISARMKRDEILAALQGLEASLSAQMNAPSEANVLAMSVALKLLKERLSSAEWRTLPRTWLIYLDEIGFTRFLGDVFATRIDRIIRNGSPTMADARDKIVNNRKALEKFLLAFDQIVTAADTLKLKEKELEPGEGELAVVIPRAMFGNEIRDFAAQTKELDRILSCITELATGRRESAQIRQISTTDPVFFLLMAPIALKYFLEALNSLLDAYEKVLRIRKMRAELAATLPASTLEVIEADAQRQMTDTIAALVPRLSAAAAPTLDVGRRNELTQELNRGLVRLANGIDHGMRFEAAIAPPVAAVDEADETPDQRDVRLISEKIAVLAAKVRRYELIGEPILNLPPPANDDLA